MKVVILPLCFLVLMVTGSTRVKAEDVNSPDYLALQELVVSQLRPHRDVYATWIPALVNSPESPTNYNGKQARADVATCNACHAALDVLKLLRNSGLPATTISELIIGGCQILQIVKPDVCRGAILSYANPVLRILDDKKELTTHDFCGILYTGCGFVNEALTNWTINIDQNKPPVGPPAPPLDDTVLRTKILQFTDIHLDLDYVVGSNSECDRPAGCCRNYDGVPDPTTPETTAGEFGHFKCSLPERALDAIFEHAKTTHADPKPKYIFLTGDFIHSAIWLYSVPENTRHLGNVTTKLKDAFPDVPIYPVVGNHEPNVVNMFPPNELWTEGFDLQWMYEIVSEPFKEYIGEEISTFAEYGYYSVRPDPTVPFRLVVLNTNLCYLQNFWLLYNTVDPTDQLQWFADTMLRAERSGEIVYILGHIQPGSGSCWKVWADKFDKIVKRFHAIIKGQWYGHNHREYFALAFDEEENPINVLYMGPSGVTDNGHSAYKLYEVDGDRGVDSTWEIIDHKTYILNLPESNAQDRPIIQELFSAKSKFDLKSQRPADLYEFVNRMVTDKELFKTYLSTHYKGAPHNYGPCEDDECRGNTLCDLVVANSGDITACTKIKQMIHLAGTTTTTPRSGASGLKFTFAVLVITAFAFIYRY